MPEWTLELHLSAVPESVPAVRQVAVDFARRLTSRRGLDDVALAITEAASNVVRHAYRDAERPGSLMLMAEVGDAEFSFLVCDEGPGPSGDSANGDGERFGMRLIAATTSAVERFDEDLHCLALTFPREDP